MTTTTAITVNQEYASLVPQLSAEEYQSLKDSIKQNGLWTPITVNDQGVILDGHHRYKACQELGLEPKTVTKDFPDKLQEQMFVIDSNLQRRQLNNFQRTELALKSKSILDQIVKRNESSGGKGVRILTPVGRVDENVGKLAGVSRDTVRRVQEIEENAPETIKQSLRSGKMSINEAIEQIRIQAVVESDLKQGVELRQPELQPAGAGARARARPRPRSEPKPEVQGQQGEFFAKASRYGPKMHIIIPKEYHNMFAKVQNKPLRIYWKEVTADN